MAEYTLTYEGKRVKGWTSFYSFIPDFMIGMNNYFYTFKGGDLFRHNVNNLRNNFYGIQYGSSLTSVFNESPIDNKLFKTIAIQGTNAWSLTMTSDVQTSGTIDETWFEKKEQVWFAFMRNSGETPAGDDEYVLRSVNGISTSSTVDTTTPTAVLINFNIAVQVGGIISVGDNLYFGFPAPTYCGQVTAININLPNGLNQLVVDTTVGNLPPSGIEYFFYIKSAIAESHGILGHYGRFVITNSSTEQVELFAVQSDVMKSYP
jgi:hypothetical protein